jgi:predicted amidohydrolase YtcJ
LSQYPIFLIQISGHYASLNALALLKSKIMDKSGRFYRGSDAECLTVDGRSIGDTFSPEQRAFGSFFHMGQQGGSHQISGAIFHHYAMEEFFLRARKFADYPEMDEEELITALKQRSREFIRMGVTSIYDNNLRSVRFLDTVKRYPQIATPEEKLRLTLHPYICDLRRGAFPAFDSGARKGILSRMPPCPGEWVRLLGYKLQVDAAAMTGFTWDANRSFGGQEAGRVNLWEYDDLLEIVREIDKIGAQVSIHVIGDKALDWTLDAFEKAQVGTKDRRHRLEHLMVVPDESRNSLTRKSEPLMKRAANLGLVFCPQPGFILYYASFWENAYGSGVGRNKIQQSFPRMAHSVPYRSAVEAGVRVALSSDNPCVPNPSPLLALWESVHRRTQRLFYQGRLLLDTFNFNHEDAQGRLVDERVDFTQALRGHTIDAAYCGREEAIKGSLENGKLADLVVWNKDIRTLGERVPVTAVQEMKPVMTLIDGRIAYQDDAAGIRIDRA